MERTELLIFLLIVVAVVAVILKYWSKNRD